MTTDPALTRRLRDAHRYVPMYRQLWGTGDGATPDLASLPLLTKAVLLSTPAHERLDSRYAGRSLTRLSTSGSTGQPIEIELDSASARRRQARFLWGLWQAGYRPGQRLMLISSRPAQAIKQVSPWARLARWHYADLYLGEAGLAAAYRRIRPDVVYGPLSALLMLCRAAISTHRPRAVLSTAEQLTPSAARTLRTSLCADVTDLFGMTELGLVACKPAHATGYLVPEGTFILEFLPCHDLSGLERLVVTSLAPSAMPFIRYETGDLVRRDLSQPGSPIVELAGKQLDFLHRPDGTRVSPYDIDRALGELAGVRQYRVVQERDYSIRAFVTVEAGAEAVIDTARQRLQTLCSALPVTVEGEQPDPSTSHKLRPVSSHVRTDA